MKNYMAKRLGMSFALLGMSLLLTLSITSCAKRAVRGVEPTMPPTREELRQPAVEREPLPGRRGMIEEEALREEGAPAAGYTGDWETQTASFENEDIHFDFDRAVLREDAKEILRKKSAWLLDNLSIGILIEGHCDERGTTEYNLALGERRAASAKSYLISRGVDINRITTISYGEERPLDPGRNEEAWAKNRRAHFVIIR